ncbi:MAG: hypothetical protein HN712_24355 [Gemmatimonadetes bacterium]|jgi:L-2-hydroxycarboxylate dehydrogenase (NAD+)|nr:hypothetical protein [Gemmatimonadota bacterium]MBT7863470.1 hypothetical protein [Gemmatimonadota bacterium]
MNRPPEEFRRVDEMRLIRFITECFCRSGLDEEHAQLISRLLVNNDLRGVRSHASRSAGGYCNGFVEGHLNPQPDLRIVVETDALAVFDGDGTLGYLPMVRAAEAAVAKARVQGIGAGLVRHIGHYGSSGHYTRICVEADCVGYSVQGYRGEAEPKSPPRSAADSGNPPVSFAIPAGDESPIVLDAGAAFDSPFPVEGFEEMAHRHPAPFFKSMGMIAVSTMIGGTLTGFLGPEGDRIAAQWPGARMGGTIIALDPQRLGCADEFRADVDRYVRDIRQGHTPLPGTDRALLPGAIEAERFRQYRQAGIPLGDREQVSMRSMSERFDVPLPWDEEGS